MYYHNFVEEKTGIRILIIQYHMGKYLPVLGFVLNIFVCKIYLL